MRLLDDDKEYIEAIKEASFWGSAHSVRTLFAMLLLFNSTSKPEYVWEQTWEFLSDDILYKQRRFLGMKGIILTPDITLIYYYL